ncbi:MAG: aminoacyl-tRNA hydrolase [Bacillota bacterium]|jgi:PTH1 family peptidyl-tRNA hydrolase
MKCVVGLGNPGKKYRNTRHNVGYRVLDEIAGRFRLAWSESGFSERALATVPFGGGVDLLLVRPLTYMNSSGVAVSEVMEDYDLPAADVLVIHDDMDLPLGKVRFKRKGSSGGHRGIESIIEETGTSDFPRLKIGVGRPPEGVDPAEYVLSRFSGDDEEILAEVIRLAAEATLDAVSRGIDWAMAHYNGLDAALESGGR